LAVINSQGVDVLAYSCGMFADAYRRLISERGRRNLGSPYLACFNSCIATVAWMMEICQFPAQDKFSVLIDKENDYERALESFGRMKENPEFGHRSRLAACAAAMMDDATNLQTADLIAYELFKWAHYRGRGRGEIRPILPRVIKRHVLVERYWDSSSFGLFKDRIESEPAGDGQHVIVLAS
jgi:hypothetical protein